jgi:hypothetical protein
MGVDVMQAKQMFSWMNPKLEVRETGHYGKGVYATDAIAANEMLFVMGGYVLTIEDENNLRGVVADKPIEISEQFSIGPRRPSDLARMPQHYINHSCEPNVGFKGQIFLQAMRRIESGEEITYDYAMSMHPNPESSSFFTMECRCGRPDCRSIVTENDWQIPKLQQRYDGWFQWFLQEKIDRAKRDRVASHGSIKLDKPEAGSKTLRGGRGVFVREQVRAGERLAIFGGYVMPIAEEPELPGNHSDFALQVDEYFVLGLRCEHELGGADYFNHSCNPNAGIRGQIFLDAMRDIAPDEEITFDYAMVLYGAEGIPPYKLECHCGSPNCRGRVTDSDWLLPELQQRYHGYFSWFLQEKIDRMRHAAP